MPLADRPLAPLPLGSAGRRTFARGVRSAPGLAVLALAVLSTAGCGLFGGGRRAEEPPPTPEPVRTMTVALDGGADMNAGGNAARVYVYLLADAATFRGTPIQAFWQDDVGLLGTDLVGTRREVLLYPGSAEAVEIELADGTAFLGVAADLRDPEGETWRAVHPVGDLRGRTLRVQVGPSGLSTRVE